MEVNIKVKKKTKTVKYRDEFANLGKLSKKELNELKEAYKSNELKFDSSKVAKAILEDKEVRKGILK